MKQEIIIEDAFRTDNVDGAVVTAMGIVAREKDGGLSAFIDVDDGKGLLTYNLMVKGDVAGIPDAKDIKRWKIPGYLDFSKFNKALRDHGYVPYIDLENNSWETEPPLVGKKVWIDRIKTSTATDGKEYFSHIKIVKIGDETLPPIQDTSPQGLARRDTDKIFGKNPQQPASPPAAQSNDLKQQWTGILSEILTTPCNEIEINSAVRKAFPNDATLRKRLSDVRKQTLSELVSDGVLELTDDGKYQLAV